MSDLSQGRAVVSKEKHTRLSGIITPVITPLAESERLDLDTAAILFERLIRGGVSGIFLLGTTGEFAGISHRCRHEFVRESIKLIAGRVPVYVGISDTSFTESVELGRLAADCGADALVVTAPYYYRFTGDVMRIYLSDLANNVPAPLILYNMPGNTNVVFDEETVKFVIDTPKFIAIKDSGGDLGYFFRLCRLAEDREDFAVMMGPDRLLKESIDLGAAGGVNSGSNLCPEVFVGLYRAALARNSKLVDEYQAKILLIQDLYHTLNNGLAVTSSIKTALELLGIGKNCLTKPFLPPCAAEVEEIRKILVQLGPAVGPMVS